MPFVVKRVSQLMFLFFALGVLPAISGCGGSYISESAGTTQAEQPDDDPDAMSDPAVDPDTRRRRAK